MAAYTRAGLDKYLDRPLQEPSAHVPSHDTEPHLSHAKSNFAKTYFLLFLVVRRRVIVGAAGGADTRLINILLCRVVWECTQDRTVKQMDWCEVGVWGCLARECWSVALLSRGCYRCITRECWSFALLFSQDLKLLSQDSNPQTVGAAGKQVSAREREEERTRGIGTDLARAHQEAIAYEAGERRVSRASLA